MAGIDEVLSRVRLAIPTLSPTNYKGQAGRVGVVGGHEDGAAFFVALAAQRVGADISHIICPPEAGDALKIYGPDLVVHPILRQEYSSEELESILIPLFRRFVVLVISTSLEEMQDIARVSLVLARKLDLPTIVDGHALHLLEQESNLIRGWKDVILTPNMHESEMLTTWFTPESRAGIETTSLPQVTFLSEELGGVCILIKGEADAIGFSGETPVEWRLSNPTCPKRSNGQGGILCGAIATVWVWLRKYDQSPGYRLENSSQQVALAAISGAKLTRCASMKAFQKHGRGMITSDILKELPVAFEDIFHIHAISKDSFPLGNKDN